MSTDRQLNIGDVVEVRLLPYPGAQVTWEKAQVLGLPDKDGTFMAVFLDGFTYHGSTRTMVQKGNWR